MLSEELFFWNAKSPLQITVQVVSEKRIFQVCQSHQDHIASSHNRSVDFGWGFLPPLQSTLLIHCVDVGCFSSVIYQPFVDEWFAHDRSIGFDSPYFFSRGGVHS